MRRFLASYSKTTTTRLCINQSNHNTPRSIRASLALNPGHQSTSTRAFNVSSSSHWTNSKGSGKNSSSGTDKKRFGGKLDFEGNNLSSNNRGQQSFADSIKSKLGINRQQQQQPVRKREGHTSGSHQSESYFDNKKSNAGKKFGKMSAGDSQSGGSSIRHDKDKRRFVMDLGDNMIARIDYKPIGKNKIEMYHTEVPEQLRGRGIGKALARASLEHATEDGMKVKLTCEYLIKYFDHYADARLKESIID